MHNVSHLLNTGCCGFIKGLKLLFSDVTNLDQKLFFFFHPKEAAQPQFYVWIPFLLFMFPLCFFASVHLICELFGFLSFFFYRTTDGVVFLLRNNQNYISEPVQQSGAFWKSYARTRAHLSEEGSIKCSKLLWSKISEQSCWTEVAVYLSWPWQTPARFTIQ